MLFEKLRHQMTSQELAALVPQDRLKPVQKPATGSNEAKADKSTATFTFNEPATGSELLHQMTFRDGKLSFLCVSMNGDFTQHMHVAMCAVANAICKAQQKRGIMAPAETSPFLAWKELIESPLPAADRSEERSIRIHSASWDVPGWNIQLNYSWTWPGQLYLTYREEEVSAASTPVENAQLQSATLR